MRCEKEMLATATLKFENIYHDFVMTLSHLYPVQLLDAKWSEVVFAKAYASHFHVFPRCHILHHTA